MRLLRQPRHAIQVPVACYRPHVSPLSHARARTGECGFHPCCRCTLLTIGHRALTHNLAFFRKKYVSRAEVDALCSHIHELEKLVTGLSGGGLSTSSPSSPHDWCRPSVFATSMTSGLFPEPIQSAGIAPCSAYDPRSDIAWYALRLAELRSPVRAVEGESSRLSVGGAGDEPLYSPICATGGELSPSSPATRRPGLLSTPPANHLHPSLVFDGRS